MARQTAKKEDAPAMPVAETVTAFRIAEAGVPTMDPSSLLSVTRQEAEVRPMMAPPSEVVEQDIEAEGIAAWHNGKKITATWSNASARNAYAAVAGLGWKRLSNANDSSFLALVMLASHAEQTNATCNIEIGSDGEIHQIYVW